MKTILTCDNNLKNNNIRNRAKTYIDISFNNNDYHYDFNLQQNFINKIFLGEDFNEKKLILSEIKNKLNSYKQQDIKKNLHEISNLITLDNIIEKLVCCKLKCYYCNNNMYILFEKIRESNQWTLDRLNNFDEHSNKNTIICCLKCNLQRRRKNSDKFLFTKKLETHQIKIKKIE